MKIWKRNAIIATVLLFVCAGIYLNWSYNNKQPAAAELTDTLDAEQVMGEGLVISDPSDAAVEEASAQAGAQMGLFCAGAPEPSGVARQRRGAAGADHCL